MAARSGTLAFSISWCRPVIDRLFSQCCRVTSVSGWSAPRMRIESRTSARAIGSASLARASERGFGGFDVGHIAISPLGRRERETAAPAVAARAQPLAFGRKQLAGGLQPFGLARRRFHMDAAKPAEESVVARGLPGLAEQCVGARIFR